MKTNQQIKLTLLFTLLMIAGFAFGTLAQDKVKKEKKVVEIVDEENGIEKRATATFEDGEWKYEGNPEMIEKLKGKIEAGGADGNSFVYESEDGAKVVKKKFVHDGDSEHDINVEVIIDEEGGHQNMMFIDEEGQVTHVNVEGGDGDYAWVHKEEDDNGNSVFIISGDMDKITEEKMENFKVLIEEGADREKILEELDIKQEGENIYISIDKTIDVEVENGEESKSHKVVVVIKKFEVEEIEEQELPKSMKRGFTLNGGGALNGVNFYPNPSDGEFNVKGKTELTEEPIDILITDMNGKKVEQKTITNHNGTLDYRINIKDREPGLYLVRISQNGEGVVKKIVVN